MASEKKATDLVTLIRKGKDKDSKSIDIEVQMTNEKAERIMNNPAGKAWSIKK